MKFADRCLMMKAHFVEARLYQWAVDNHDKEVWHELKRRADNGAEFWLWLLSVQELIRKGHSVREAMDIYTPVKMWATPSWRMH